MGIQGVTRFTLFCASKFLVSTLGRILKKSVPKNFFFFRYVELYSVLSKKDLN